MKKSESKGTGSRGDSPSHPDNGRYCEGEGGPSVPKSQPVDPAENKKTKNASKP